MPAYLPIPRKGPAYLYTFAFIYAFIKYACINTHNLVRTRATANTHRYFRCAFVMYVYNNVYIYIYTHLRCTRAVAHPRRPPKYPEVTCLPNGPNKPWASGGIGRSPRTVMRTVLLVRQRVDHHQQCTVEVGSDTSPLMRSTQARPWGARLHVKETIAQTRKSNGYS